MFYLQMYEKDGIGWGLWCPLFHLLKLFRDSPATGRGIPLKEYVFHPCHVMIKIYLCSR